MAVIEFENVSFSYDGAARALADASLRIEAGEFVCLLGANGSGKTTLARHIDALLLPERGAVRVLGRDTRHPESLLEIRSNVGMVFQNPDDQIVASLVEDDVAFGPENLGVSPGEIRSRVADALGRVGLTGFERRETAALSGGEKQRLAIAGALALCPQILVLDEPTSLLDPHGRARLMETCRELNGAGLTIVLVTHLLDEASHASRVIVLDGGRIAWDAAAGEVLGDKERLRELGLVAPFTRRARTGAPPAGSPGEKAVLQADRVSFAYRANARAVAHPALDQATIALREREILGIAGRTGSGKSTLLRIMGGLARPTGGGVSLQSGQLAGKRGAGEPRLDIGVVFQHPERQLFAATVFDDVAFGPRNLGLPPEKVEERVRDALELVGLDFGEIRLRSPFSVSGGQQRRVAIAGVLACRPAVLVMDEPTAGLDPKARASLLDLIDRLNYDFGMPIAIASHNMDDLMSLCDRIAVLEAGAIREILDGHSKSYKSLAALLNA